MNVRSFLKNVLTTDSSADQSTAQDPEGSTSVSDFLSGTSRFLDSVQTKKNGLFNDISNKLSSIKMSTDVARRSSTGKRDKSHVDGEDESSASEYGDEGDKPMYTEVKPLQHQESMESVDSLPENEAKSLRGDIRTLVTAVFEESGISHDVKARFCDHIKRHTGRSAFSKEVKAHIVHGKSISSNVLQELSHYAAEFLMQCNQHDDFVPATQLLQSSFTLYHEVKPTSITEHSEQQYLFSVLRDKPIWQSMRFWNAAFFICLQDERRKQTVSFKHLEGNELLEAVKEAQENAVFLQISKFLWRMRALGVAKEPCLEFLRKQADAKDLSKDKYGILLANFRKLCQTDTTENLL